MRLRLAAPLFLLAGCLTPVGYRAGDGGLSGGGGGGQTGSTGVAGMGVAGTGGHAGSGSGPTTGTAGTNGTTGVAGHGAGGTAAPTGIAGTTGGSVTGIAGTSGAGKVLYADNFENDTVGMPPPPAAWVQGDTTAGLGTWTVMSDGTNVLQGAATGSDFTVDVGGNVVWTNYSFQVDVKVISGSSWEVGVYGRFALDATNKAAFYEAYMDDSGSVQLRVKQSGSTNTLGTKSKATTAPVLGTVYTFKLDMNGSTITISVNGVVRVMATDVTLTAGGIGVIVEGGTAEFDNVVVTSD